jgi:hypothetical protein
VRVFLSLNIAPISSGHHVNIAFAKALAEKKSARPTGFELQCAGTIFPSVIASHLQLEGGRPECPLDRIVA